MARKGNLMSLTLKKILLTSLILFVITGCNEKNESLQIQEKNTKNIETKKQTILENEEKVITEEAEIVPVLYPEHKIERTSSIANKSSIKNFDFNIIKKGYKDNNTLLIVGGIQGDEPGGFMAASLIATHYDITKGSVWIVPNLNFTAL